MAGIDLPSVQLAAIVMESTVYGMFLVLFVGCVYILLHRRRTTQVSAQGDTHRQINWTLFITTLILFAAITSHWVIDIRRLFLAFVISKEGPLEYYANISKSLDLARLSLFNFIYMVGDSIMVYRLWVTWNHNKPVVLFPICTLFGLAAVTSGVIIQLHKLKPGEDIFVSSGGRFITSAFTLTLVTNIYSTSMIAFKIWSVNKNMRRMGGGNLTSVIIIIAESAAVYTTFVLLSLILYLAKSNVQFAMIDVTSPVVGVVFCLITVRVTLGLSFGAISDPSTTSSWSTSVGTARSGSHALRMTPIRIDIQRHIDVEGGGKDVTISSVDTSGSQLDSV